MKYQQYPIVLLMQRQGEAGGGERPAFLSESCQQKSFSIGECPLIIWHDPQWASEARILQHAIEEAASDQLAAWCEQKASETPLLAIIAEAHLDTIEQKEVKKVAAPKGLWGSLWSKQRGEAPSCGYYATASANGIPVCTYHPASPMIGSYPYHWAVIGEPDPAIWEVLKKLDGVADYSALLKGVNSRFLRLVFGVLTWLMNLAFDRQEQKKEHTHEEEGNKGNE